AYAPFVFHPSDTIDFTLPFLPGKEEIHWKGGVKKWKKSDLSTQNLGFLMNPQKSSSWKYPSKRKCSTFVIVTVLKNRNRRGWF
ncbi:MAG: hypothetical protein J7J80_05110, partial [Thermotogae bacterium]|nr:hypothetical protein [Thermotogota bacterium]